MPRVLISPEQLRETAGPHLNVLRDAGLEFAYPQDPQFTRGLGPDSQTVEELHGFDAVIAGGERLHRGVLAQLPKLRVIARAGVGFDRVEIPACTDRKIAVTITPTANHEAVAEHTFALLFAVAKSIASLDKMVRGGGWISSTTKPVRGQTIGLVGLGRIGRSTALRGIALGMNVVAYETMPDMPFVEKHKIKLVPLDQLLAQSDYVSIHCPLNDQTRGMFNRELFQKMKRGSVLLNTARGGLVKEVDLVEALKSGHLGGCGLDVFEQEPPQPDNPLFGLSNAVLSPHLAGTDTRSMQDMATEAASCIASLYRGHWPHGAVVNADLEKSWAW